MLLKLSNFKLNTFLTFLVIYLIMLGCITFVLVSITFDRESQNAASLKCMIFEVSFSGDRLARRQLVGHRAE